MLTDKKPSLGSLTSSITLTLAAIFLLFIIKGFFNLSPDFGWHLRFGSLVMTNGWHVPQLDPFSISMSNYRFVNHEWLLDVFIAASYPLVGMLGLSIVFSGITLLSLITALHLTQSNKYTAFLLIFASIPFYSFIGVRDQVVSFLFFSCLLHLLFNKKFANRKYLLIPFFLLWANIHGAFVLGLGIAWVTVFFNFLQKDKTFKKDIAVLFLSSISTLINPYGIHLWLEIFRSTPPPHFLTTVVEWMPLISQPNLAHSFYLTLCFLLVLRLRNHFQRAQLVLFFLLLVAGITQMRHFPFFILFSLPMLASSLDYLDIKIKNVHMGVQRKKKAEYVFLAFFILFMLPQLYFLFRDTLLTSEQKYYPKVALTQNDVARFRRIFTPYNWGGYVLWKIPDSKVFVDGRMPHWKLKNPGTKESPNAFQESQDIIDGKHDLEHITTKYTIDTFILPSSYLTTKPLLLDDLKKTGFLLIFQDKKTLIFYKENPS